MNDSLQLASALIAGVLLGAVFFGGLWWTVRKAVSSERVALWFLGSMLLRTGIVMLGFYYVMEDNWQKLLAGLIGFILARVLVMRLTRETEQSDSLAQKADDAP